MIFSEIYDEIYKVVKEALIDHVELDDNVVIENNNDRKLQKGFAVSFNGAQNTNQQLDCLMSAKQSVVITNTLANFGSELDLEARKKAEKSLFENCYKIVKEIEQNTQLNGTVELVSFDSHNGIELLISNEEKIYYMIQATYSVEWFKQKGE